MKALLLIFLFPCLAASQDSTLVSSSQLIRAAERIKEQQDSIMHLKRINSELTNQNNIQSVVIRKKDVEISLLESKINIGGDIITDYSEHLKKDKRIKNQRVFYFIGGIATAYVSSLIMKNTLK